MSIPEIRPPYW
ncbi:hypothetical protein LINPERPRIM_LOCUS30015 [Linum perenne]